MAHGTQKVPFVDLKAQVRAIGEAVRAELAEVMESCAFALGPKVAAFEERFAAYCGCEAAVAVNSGTAALHLALLAAGVGPGDEVITVSHTFIATSEAVSHCGAAPVFVDVDEATYAMDPALVEAAATERTKAILPVHLYGQPFDVAPIAEIAARRGLALIEDACQAHGAEYNGQRVGSLGLAAGFSFYPGKNLGAYGEGGAITTNDPDVAARCRMLRDHGSPRKYYHDVVGYNYRMSGFQGAVLGVKLGHLDAWTDARRAHAARYNELLADVDVVAPVEAPGRKHVYHLYVVRCADRDGLRAALDEAGVASGIHYPLPVHLQAAYADLGYQEGSLPVTEKVAKEIVSLPMYPELTDEQIALVVEAIESFVG
jgi:dTDP-4-amino-4,6-dideoxygalactose transaminase